MRRSIPILTALVLAPALLAGCATTGLRPGATSRSEVGFASFYATRFHGHRMANGERYDEHELTAAHRTLPFGTRVLVTNLANDRAVTVTITDRGPSRRKRILDVSKRAARELGFERAGTAKVRVEVVAD